MKLRQFAILCAVSTRDGKTAYVILNARYGVPGV